MKKVFLSFSIVVSLLLFSCDKENKFATPQGGNLPTNYIIITSGEVTPLTTRVVMGSSITFVNNDDIAHAFITDDSTTFRTGPIEPHTSYFFQKDTMGNFPFHCEQHPEVRGLIIIE